MTAPLRRQVEAVLAEGPGTAMDVAIELERDSRRTGAYLRALWARGLLARQPYHPPERGPSIRRVVWLYSLQPTTQDATT